MTTEILLFLFLGFVFAMSAAVVVIAARRFGGRVAIAVALGLSIWFAYVCAISRSGMLGRVDVRPPGIVFILVPVVAYLLVTTRSVFSPRSRWPLALPTWLTIGTQGFRIVVELFIHSLWLARIVPKTLTYSGENVDLYIGVSAPLIAWLATRGRRGRTVALAWNGLGLLALANVVVRAILTTPGPLNFIHTDPPNRMFATFPYPFIPAFFVPLAVTLHVVAIRTILSRQRQGVGR